MSIATRRRARARLIPGLVALLACGQVLPGPAAADEIRIAHAQGETVLPGVPQKVAVLNLAALDTLQALGVEVAGVPKANFPSYLSAYRDPRHRQVGSLFEPDQAALQALAPDLIVVGGRSRSAYPALSKLAPTLDLDSGDEGFIDGAIANVRTLGRIFAREEQAQALAGQLQATVADLHAKARTQGTGLMLFAVNGNINAQAPGSRFGVVHELAGIPSVLPRQDAEAGPRPAAGSPEAQAARRKQEALLAQALAAEPDWLFVLDRDTATGGESSLAEALAKHPQIVQSAAWKAQRVIHLDAPTWYLVGNGPGAIQQSAAQIAAAFEAAER